MHHGRPSSRPDPIGFNVSLPARESFRVGGHSIHFDPAPQYVRSSRASRMGGIPYTYGGFFRQAPPPDYGYYHHGHGGTPAHHRGAPSAHLSSSVQGVHHVPSGGIPLFVYGGVPLTQGHGGYPRAAASVAPSLVSAG